MVALSHSSTDFKSQAGESADAATLSTLAALPDVMAKRTKSTGEPILPVPSLDRIVGPSWTKDQLIVVAEADREVQRYSGHMSARITLAHEARLIDAKPIRTMVSEIMGGVAGTYYITAAFQLAQLAILFRHRLTTTQYALLLAPLEAAERADDLITVKAFVRDRIHHWRQEHYPEA